MLHLPSRAGTSGKANCAARASCVKSSRPSAVSSSTPWQQLITLNMENNKKDNYCVIMAGGIGSRFWPMSTAQRPKQFLDVLGIGKSLLRMTFERMLHIAPAE